MQESPPIRGRGAGLIYISSILHQVILQEINSYDTVKYSNFTMIHVISFVQSVSTKIKKR